VSVNQSSIRVVHTWPFSRPFSALFANLFVKRFLLSFFPPFQLEVQKGAKAMQKGQV
jgi:hypothetical protein